MSFQPVLPLAGIAGWQFLSRTRAAQQESFSRSAQATRDVDYFKQKIASVTTADQLVQDRRLLSVALGAFGLEADINSKAFIRKVLEGGTLDSSALANRLSDKRYYQMAEAFGFGDPGLPNTQLSDFPQKIISAYHERRFEAAVGEQQPDLRLALGFARDLNAIAQKQTTENGRWFSVMGNLPLRQVFEKALGLPTAFGRLDIDRQLDGFRQAAKKVFGTDDIAKLAAPDLSDSVIRKFLARSQVDATQSTLKGQMALTLLQAARR